MENHALRHAVAYGRSPLLAMRRYGKVVREVRKRVHVRCLLPDEEQKRKQQRVKGATHCLSFYSNSLYADYCQGQIGVHFIRGQSPKIMVLPEHPAAQTASNPLPRRREAAFIHTYKPR